MFEWLPTKKNYLHLRRIYYSSGIPEITKQGSDITLVTYGSTWRLVSEAAKELEKVEISCEVIDVQSLLPFDIKHSIVESLKKTNKVVFIDEDVSSGATAYMMQKY